MEHSSKDLRVRRTLKAIRTAFDELVLEKNYSEISITELTERAEINRKTFYLHYASLDDLVAEVEQEIVANISKDVDVYADALDMPGCIRAFYLYLDNCNDVEYKLLCDPHYHFVYENVTDAVMRSDAFSKFYKMVKYPDIVRSYSICVTIIYRNWLKSGKPISLEELIDYASKIVYNGYAGVVQK